MDPRRTARTVIDPKVRQVGFFTPAAAPLQQAQSAPVVTEGGGLPSPPLSDISAGSNSLSPVMIPPPRHLSAPVSVPAPPSPLRRDSLMAFPVGSYNPSESLPETSPLPSPSSRGKGPMTEGQPERGGTKVKEKMSKAERRALQENSVLLRLQQRPLPATGTASVSAEQSKIGKPSLQKKDSTQVSSIPEKKGTDRVLEKDRKKDVPPPRMQFDDKSRVEKAKRRAVVNQSEARNIVELFRHLPQYVHGTQFPDLEAKFFQLDPMHPSVYKVGLQYLAGDISGGNNRCVAMLLAFRDAIRDYSTIGIYVSFLIECRPLSISMGNAIKSDVLLTYGCSCVVEMILLNAHELGKQFRVVIVDSRPKLEGQALLRRLVRKGIHCTYTHINAISYIMHEVTRVFLGASSVLSNGTVYSRVGAASVAMVAHAFRVPVLICCEAYKFHERVQLDSICFNELELNHLDHWADNEKLHLLNLTYDAMPSDYVSMIITDYGMVPATSVPVIIREYRREHVWI
ncbi:unnamed protein product [Spirodela intermedia]|uniref:Translation initiation factor eIF2B subunit delta n=1 Tax=Spirodela intermedia TaxID=51605 RepID=A0A7I8JMN4_SPIIN|nr:unnamed protein product [Spirodela intermedia]CAA6671416.1 unnamed protein product [Spirodela intermedia]